ncbi:transposase [Streptomyces sp. 3211.6]|uniref:transposase n=1 Tax=Streptomyces sp. 3211.6 TaxID=1938845 RepID=UPI0037D9E3AA
MDNGIKWRAMPADFPPWDRTGSVRSSGTGGIAAWSGKADAVAGAGTRGFDGGKLVNGRKRHVVVDTLGLLLGVMVTAADVGDRAAAHILLEQVTAAHHRPALVWAYGNHTGQLGLNTSASSQIGGCLLTSTSRPYRHGANAV